MTAKVSELAAPAIKPLVWRDHRPDSFPEPAWSAQTPFGFYNIEEVSASDSPAYVVRLHAHHFIADKDSLEEAKAAAQADYEQRVGSVLQEGRGLEPRGCPTPGACSCPAESAAAEPIAWTNETQISYLKTHPGVPMAMWEKKGGHADIALYRAPPSVQPRVLSHKWLDHECNEHGCQSLVWKKRYESAVQGRRDFRQALVDCRAKVHPMDEGLRRTQEVMGRQSAVKAVIEELMDRRLLNDVDADLHQEIAVAVINAVRLPS
jgi:hypothetical protein